jgi:hypothetical protein
LGAGKNIRIFLEGKLADKIKRLIKTAGKVNGIKKKRKKHQ